MSAIPRLKPREDDRALAIEDAPASPVEVTRYRAMRVRRPGNLGGPLRFAALAAAVVAVTWLAPGEALDGAAAAVEWLRGHNNDAGRAVLTTVVVASALLVLIGAWSRATSLGRPVRLGDGRGRLRVDEIAAGVRETIRERGDVREVEAAVENLGRRGLRVALVLHVTPHARLAETIEGATAAVEQLIHGRIGVPMAAPPLIELRYEELELRPGRAADA